MSPRTGWRWISRAEPAINPLVHARFAHEAPVSHLRFSADGLQLASVAEDGFDEHARRRTSNDLDRNLEGIADSDDGGTLDRSHQPELGLLRPRVCRQKHVAAEPDRAKAAEVRVQYGRQKHGACEGSDGDLLHPQPSEIEHLG